ncbi:MAG: nicotinate-nucleotide--dimethylbenzimidazole phosphoribosyltransferase [Bacteroides sp.]|nr:nicotinate-nucleotide--dimethylbenzimidazole phosphoribosyltransferase [Bacteroides sp.]MCM1420176.1 nicotinate-nucleotide--dimethylbenzimidazole phosphoribosyltransferase [Bacteroides sp.]
MNFCIQPTEKSFIAKVQEKIDNLNKPKGSLGRLESLALQLGLIQRTLSPVLNHPCHILFGADHGIERENVSISPREITWQQMLNFGRGGAGINMFCRQHGFKLHVVDVGVDYDFDKERDCHIIDRKIAKGTRNFLYESAMDETEYEKALSVGAEMTEACHQDGCNVISFGEMGIANTSPSSVWMHLFLGIQLAQCVGAGAGLDSEGQKHKYEVLKMSVDKFMAESGVCPCSETTPMSRDEVKAVIRYFGGFEMVAAIGGMLRAAELGMIVLVDGFIMTACMLAASRLYPEVMDYAVFGHKGDESGHSMMLGAMNAEPLLALGLRLGEGTGAVCAYPILQSAVNMMNEMDNFAHAEITKYF